MAALLASAFSASAFAQGMALPPGIAAETRQVYNAVKTNLIAAADAMPEANYSFSPVPEEMTFGGWVAHVADAQTGICSTLNGARKTGDAATKKSKADLVAALKASFDECDKAMDGLTDANATELICLRPRTEYARRSSGLQQRPRSGMLWQHGGIYANQRHRSAFNGGPRDRRWQRRFRTRALALRGY